MVQGTRVGLAGVGGPLPAPSSPAPVSGCSPSGHSGHSSPSPAPGLAPAAPAARSAGPSGCRARTWLPGGSSQSGGGGRGGGSELGSRPGCSVESRPLGAPNEGGFQASQPPSCPAGGDRGQRLPAEMLSLPGPLTELGPIQKFSCWMHFTLSYTPLFLSTWCRGGRMGGSSGVSLSQGRASRKGLRSKAVVSPEHPPAWARLLPWEGMGGPRRWRLLGEARIPRAEPPFPSPTHQLGGDVLGEAHRRDAVRANHQQCDDDVDARQPVGEVGPAGRGLGSAEPNSHPDPQPCGTQPPTAHTCALPSTAPLQLILLHSNS